MSLCGAIAWPFVGKSTEATAVGAIVTLPVMHEIANGHDFCRSGAGPWSGQQGMLADADAGCMASMSA
jgi:hypothetical protein